MYSINTDSIYQPLDDWKILHYNNITSKDILSGKGLKPIPKELTEVYQILSDLTNNLTLMSNNVNQSNSDINSMITIKDIKIIIPNKVVEITYKDNTKEKVVCDNEDNFSLDAAIAICALKKLMGNSKCNHYLKSGYKIINDKEKLLLKEQEEKEIIARKKEKAKLKKEKRRLKKREEQINIIAEAIKRSELLK